MVYPLFASWTCYLKNTSRESFQIWYKNSLRLKEELMRFGWSKVKGYSDLIGCSNSVDHCNTMLAKKFGKFNTVGVWKKTNLHWSNVLLITSGLTELSCSSSQLGSVSVDPGLMCWTSSGPTHPEPPLTSAACRPELSSGSQRFSPLICSLMSGTVASPDLLSGRSSQSDSGRCWCFCQEKCPHSASPSGCWWLSGWPLDCSLSDSAGLLRLSGASLVCSLSDPAGLLRLSGWTPDWGREGSEQTGPDDHLYWWGISPWFSSGGHPKRRYPVCSHMFPRSFWVLLCSSWCNSGTCRLQPETPECSDEQSSRRISGRSHTLWRSQYKLLSTLRPLWH